MYDAIFKIVVFGEPTDKKKDLMEKFSHDISETGMVTGVRFKVKNLVVDKQSIKLQIWELAAEERFRNILPMYVQGARGGLFVYDVTEFASLTHIDDWLADIKRESRNEALFPIICVALHSSNEAYREVSYKEGIEVAKSRGLAGFIECDVTTGENVDEAFEALVRLML